MKLYFYKYLVLRMIRDKYITPLQGGTFCTVDFIDYICFFSCSKSPPVKAKIQLSKNMRLFFPAFMSTFMEGELQQLIETIPEQ